MRAYIIVDTRIKNPEAYEDYKAKARPIAEKFGGVYLARGGDMDVVQDELWSPTRIVLIQFPNKDRAREFLDCEEYAPVKALRLANADCTLVLVEGE